jgi:hypothetical protein
MLSTAIVILVLAAAVALLVSVVVALEFSRSAREAGQDGAQWAWKGWWIYLAAAGATGAVLFGLGWLLDLIKGNHFEVNHVLAFVSVLMLPMIVAGLIACKMTAQKHQLRKSPEQFDDDLKTIKFLGVAAGIGLLAWAVMPAVPREDTADLRNQPLFAEFDPATVGDLDILQFDEKKALPRHLEVVRKEDGNKVRWVIPSHENYPTDVVVPSYKKSQTDQEALADAADPTKNKTTQLAEAVTSLSGLKILEVVPSSAADHALYGVVDPDPNTRKEGATGTGTRVVLKDREGNTLVGLIIGKKTERVQSADNPMDQPKGELHYVRKLDQDQVFVTDIKTEKLTTKFEKWIETNLLKLNAMDIKEVALMDHSVKVDEIIENGMMVLGYNDTGEPRWKTIVDKIIKDDKAVDMKLADDEELSNSKLDDMKRAFGDLKIVDVRRKPEGLSADLKETGSFRLTKENAISLDSRGFVLARMGQQFELFSTEGEVHCTMKDGVDYVLRFGKLATDIPDTSDEDENASKPDESDKSKDAIDSKEKKEPAGRNRYLFVAVNFDSDAIEKPKLEEVPPEEEKPADDKAAETKADDKNADDKKAGGEKPAGQKADEDPAADKKTGDEKTDEKPADKEGEKPAAKEADKAKEKAAAASKREQIIKDNQRKQDEYNEKVENGKKHVKELNARFSDWYYVISNDVYNKIHLSRADIVVKKEKPKEKGKPGEDVSEPFNLGTPAGDNPLREFDTLKQEGPDGEQ